MKLVIDISEKIYDTIMSDEMPTIEQMSAIVLRIYQGIPLPKGHGRLIDADALKVSKHSTIVEYQYINEFFPNEPVCEYTEYYRCDTIRNAPTIIEADKEVE